MEPRRFVSQRGCDRYGWVRASGRPGAASAVAGGISPCVFSAATLRSRRAIAPASWARDRIPSSWWIFVKCVSTARSSCWATRCTSARSEPPSSSRRPDLTGNVVKQWQAVDEYVAKKAYVAVFGYPTFPFLMSARMNFAAAVEQPLYGWDFSSFQLK